MKKSSTHPNYQGLIVRKSDLRKVAFVMLCQLLIISALRTLPGMSVSVNASLVESGISLSSCSASPSVSSLFNHNACVAAAVAAMNSDSQDDNATVACF
ncbi:hypothetical protein Tco_0367968 [Tanacetum coccineum]